MSRTYEEVSAVMAQAINASGDSNGCMARYQTYAELATQNCALNGDVLQAKETAAALSAFAAKLAFYEACLIADLGIDADGGHE
jgi:hypothetical protein